MLAPHADYLMLNMSCPNTEDGRDFFVDRAHIEACLAALGGIGLKIPVFMKVSSVGGIDAVERVLAAADAHAVRLGLHVQPVAGQAAGAEDAGGDVADHAGRGGGAARRAPRCR